ncbi:MAG: OmpW family outer membrane protein [Niabella sp.]
MKKITLLFAILTVGTFAATAQTEKGRFVVSGQSNLNFSSVSSKVYYDKKKVGDYGKTTSFNFTPGVGYFVIDNLSVGLDVGLNFSRFKAEGEDADKSETVSLIPSATYYFPLEGQVKPYVNAGAGYAFNSNGSSDKEKASGVAYGGSAGIAVFLKSNLSIDLGVGYTGTRLKNKYDEKIEVRAGGVAAVAGFSFYF